MSKDILTLAREAGFDLDGMANMLYTVRGNYAQLERFAELVRADEREACAKVADYVAGRCLHPDEIAETIRARSNT